MVILLTLLAIGGIFYGDVGMIYTMWAPANAFRHYGRDPYVYLTHPRANSNYGMTAAVGLSQSVLDFICVYGSNLLAKRYSAAAVRIIRYFRGVRRCVVKVPGATGYFHCQLYFPGPVCFILPVPLLDHDRLLLNR